MGFPVPNKVCNTRRACELRTDAIRQTRVVAEFHLVVHWQGALRPQELDRPAHKAVYILRPLVAGHAAVRAHLMVTMQLVSTEA